MAPTSDPTSLAHSLPPAPTTDGEWSVEQIAVLQQDLADAASPAADATTASQDSEAAWTQTKVSGRYRSAGGESELELRVDVDGLRPTRRVSGDFFRRRGGTLAYTGSFVVNAPRLSVTRDRVLIEGAGSFSFQSASPRLRISIPSVPALMPRPAAAVQFLTSSGAPGAAFSCDFVSDFFRRVEFELDHVEEVEPFRSFDTSRLQSPGRARVLTVPAAFAEAGVEMVEVGDEAPVPIGLAGADRVWTNAELHSAMQDHFQRWTPEAGWRVWLLAATLHERGDGLRGIMFDDQRRQGCAVFHDVIGGTSDQIVRAMLRTYVHELGHCFNLYHSHQKRFMNPPQPDRMDALSWMHYPAYYRSVSGSGEAAYWRAFPFQFDDDELVHLRHGFRDAVVPGGQAFGSGAADLASDVFADPVADESGLRLELRAPDRFLLGTPVVVEIKLSLTDLRGRVVNRMLHPNMGYVQVGIVKMGGNTVVYRPLITHCADPRLTTLSAEQPSVYESAYIGYGKGGHYFDSPGQYALRAVYNSPDGSVIVSNVLRLRVLAPLDRQEDELADLFLGDDQGSLLYLLGSDSDRLASGRKSLQRVLERHPDHPLADYARLVEGFNASRSFKSIKPGADGTRISVRAPDRDAGAGFLSDVFDRTRKRVQAATQTEEESENRVPPLDNISLGMAARRLGECLKDEGDDGSAATAMEEMLDFFSKVVRVPPHVRARIQRQVARVLDTPIAGDGRTSGGSGRTSETAPRPSRRSSGKPPRSRTNEGG